MLFGDGAGAVVLSRQSSREGRGLRSVSYGTDPSGLEALYVPVGGTHAPVSAARNADPAATMLQMNGRAVREFAVNAMVQSVSDVCDAVGIRPSAVDLLIPHQSNLRIIEQAATELGVPSERVVTTIATTGNTAAASIPIALNAAARDGSLVPGSAVVLVGYGGGLSRAACLISL